MTSPQLLIIDPVLIKNVLTTNFKNFHDNDFGDMVVYLKNIILIILINDMCLTD